MGLSVQLPCKLFLLSEKQGGFFFSFNFSYKDIAHLALFSKLAKDIFVLKLTSRVWAKFLSLMQIEDGVIDTECPFPAVRVIRS